MSRAAALWVSFALLGACGPKPTMNFDSTGFFRHASLPLRVGYGTPPTGKLLGPDWWVENFFEGDDDTPTRQKTKGKYSETRSFDTDSDGNDDTTVQSPTPDLRLEHRTTGARIFLKSLPLSAARVDMALHAIARNLVDGLSGSTGVLFAGDSPHTIVTHVKRNSSIIRSSTRCKLGSSEAWTVEFETADVDQLKLDPRSRNARGRLALVRTQHTQTVPGPSHDTYFPVLLVVGLISRPEYYAQHMPDFDRFLNSIGLGGTRSATPPGVPSGFRCDAPSPTRPAAVPSAPTPMPVLGASKPE